MDENPRGAQSFMAGSGKSTKPGKPGKPGKYKKRSELSLVQRQNARRKEHERKEQLRAAQKQKEKEALQIVRKAATTLGEANAKALRHEVATLTAELAALKHGEAPKNEFPGDAMAAIRDELAVLRGEATQQEKLLAEIVELKSLVTQKAQLIKARDAEKAQLIKDRHDVTVYHMSHHDKLYEKIKKLKEQNEKLNKSLQALMDDLAEMEAKLQPFKAENIVNDIDKIAKLVNVKLKDKIAKLTAKDCQADCQAQNDLLKAENEIAKLTAQNNAAGDEVCYLKARAWFWLKTDKAQMEAKIQEREKEIVELKNLVAKASQQNGIAKLMAERLIKEKDQLININYRIMEQNEKLKSESAKLWHQNDAMAEAGLKRMAESGF